VETETDGEYDFINDYFISTVHGGVISDALRAEGIWIGCNDRHSEGNFFWDGTNDACDVDGFSHVHPNATFHKNGGNPIANCVVMSARRFGPGGSSSFAVQDSNCETKLGYVCEIKIPPESAFSENPVPSGSGLREKIFNNPTTTTSTGTNTSTNSTTLSSGGKSSMPGTGTIVVLGILAVGALMLVCMFVIRWDGGRGTPAHLPGVVAKLNLETPQAWYKKQVLVYKSSSISRDELDL
jgi:hypothetical protein